MFRFPRHSAFKILTVCPAIVLFIMLLHQDFDEQRTTKDPFFVNGDTLELQISQEKCSDDIYLMIYIHSKPEHSEKRRMIRNTWASRSILEKHRAKLLFITGKVTDDNLQAFLESEIKLYKDIIQGTFTDTYRNLSYKAITALKWVTENCPSATFVLKTDDDVIVDINRLVQLMRSYIEPKLGKQNILAGYTWTNARVARNKRNKWYTSYGEFPEESFLKYCSGSAYIMTYDVVKKFYLKSREVPFFWIDDYFVTGMLAYATNVTHSSLNDRYIVENIADIRTDLKKDVNARVIFIHSPDTSTSLYIWHSYFERG